MSQTFSQECICSQSFSDVGAFTRHRKLCKRSKKRLSGALTQVQELYKSKKHCLEVEENSQGDGLHHGEMEQQGQMRDSGSDSASSSSIGPKDDDAPLSDMLPEPPMPLPPPDQEFDHGSPQLPQSLELIPPSPELITPPPSIPRPRHGFKTQANSFGLFCLYDEETVPSHDPQNCSGTEDPLLPTRFVFGANQNIDHPFYPYPNETSLRLGDWCNFKKLLDIIVSSEFQPEDIRDTNWMTIDRELGNLGSGELDHDEHNAVSEEWLDTNTGWKRTTITISVPFPQRSAHPGPKDYSIDNFYHRSLMSIIREKVLDPVHHQLFHYEPYELRWQPLHKARDVRVHGELFTSKSFLEAHRILQESPSEPDCDLPCRIVALMLWSDATHLTSFSDVKLWPLYVYFGNKSKDKRCQPSAHLCTHAAYFQGLPDSFKDFALENTGSKLPGDPFFTHCRRELFHAQWQELLDNEFIYAYAHGIVLTCCNGVKHHLFPQIFTYSADYPEKVLIATIRNLGTCPCPQCLIPKDHVHNVASEIDVLQRRILAHRDTEERCEKVAAARKLIYEQQYVVNTPQVEALLKNESLVPTKNAFSDRLGHLGFNFYLMLVVDLLHEFELGVWKAIFIHLLYRQVPTFGHDTVCCFRRNVSEMKKMAACDFEDLLQCAIPVFAGLFPGPHHSQILKLMFLLGHWHGLARLRMHTDKTLNILESVTKHLGDELCKFVSETCPAFSAKELRREAECCRRRQTQESGRAVAQAQGNDRRPKVLNLRTYKLHALGDYAAQIKQYGTTDSYSTQPARIRHILVCAQRNALTKYDPAPNILEQHYVIGKSQNFPEDLTRFVQSTLEDLAAKDFLGKLKTHLLPQICEIHLGRDHANVSQFPTLLHNSGWDDLNQVLFKGNRIYWHHLCCINYTTYDLRRETETVNPKTEHRNIMLLACPDGPSTHPFRYARVLGVYHTNIIYNGLDARDYQSSRLEFLWHCALDTARFVSMAKADACSFVDPADVLRCCHLIPAFADGWLHPDGIATSLRAQDSDDWKHYYINRFVDRDMVMRYHWSLGVGHVYAYSNPTKDNQPDDCQVVGSGQADVTVDSAHSGPDSDGMVDGLPVDDGTEEDDTLWMEMESLASDEKHGPDSSSDHDDTLINAMYESKSGEGGSPEDFECDGYKF
ncbi:hypothetical protein BDN67DRAFT_992684 [Paxillus ammoniavirescens]|nr:hypothetical protein BDN67DRAFT_992684 [Paxillus ammoniavirescens]